MNGFFKTREQYEHHQLTELERHVRIAMEPFIQAKVRAINCMMPKIVISPDSVDMRYESADQKILDDYDKLIVSAREQAIEKFNADNRAAFATSATPQE